MPVRRTCSAWYLAIHDLPPRADLAQLVELGVVAVADQAPFLEGQRRVVDQRGLDLGADLGAELERRLELGEPLRPPRGQPGLDPGQQGQRPRQRDQVARRGAAGADPRGQPLQVVRLAEQRRAGRCAGTSRASSSATASCRSAISSGRVRGDVSQSASSRAPIGVTVRSMTWSSEPSRLPSRRVRVSSRLRRVISSSASGLGAAVGGQPGDVAERRSSASRGGRPPGPRRPATSMASSSTPKPARVVVPNCSKSVLRACSGWKSHEGRVVIARPGWPRSVRTQGASRLSSETRISAGLSRAISSASSVRETPVSENRPGRELDPGQAELAPDLDDGRQVVGRLRVEQLLVGQRARRDDADDLALDQPLGEPRVLDLLADRRPLARLDELGQVRLERRVGKPRHRQGVRRPCRGVVSARPSSAEARSASSPNIS